jgi:hypothetical protein
VSYQIVPYCVFAAALRGWNLTAGACTPNATGDFGCLYIARSSNGMIKVGFSRNVERRARGLKCELLFIVPDVFESVEYWFHWRFARLEKRKFPRPDSEWYDESGPVGCFLEKLKETMRIAAERAPAIEGVASSILRASKSTVAVKHVATLWLLRGEGPRERDAEAGQGAA